MFKIMSHQNTCTVYTVVAYFGIYSEPLVQKDCRWKPFQVLRLYSF